MSFICRQSYKKSLEFACLLGKKWLIKKNVDDTPLLPVAQHSLHAAGKELLPQYKQLYDYILRGGAAALPLVLFALKVFATVGFLVNIGWKVWWIEEMIVCMQPN